MSDQEQNEEQDGGAFWAEGSRLINIGMGIAALLIALVYSRSCFTAPAAEIAAGAGGVAAVVPAAPSIAGTSVDGSSVELFGNGDVGQTVEVYANGSSIGQAEVRSDGTWRLVTADLPEADYEAVASNVGRAFDQSERVSFTIGEPLPAIELMKPEFASWLAGSTLTAGRDLVITGTGTPSARHILFVNGEEIGSTIAQENGSFVFVLPEAAAGEYDIQVVALGDGDDQLASDDLSVMIVDPTPAVQAAPADEDAGVAEEGTADAEPVFEVAITEINSGENSDTPVTISGTATPGSNVVLLIDGVSINLGPTDEDGNWSFTGILPSGQYNIEAQTFAENNVTGSPAAFANDELDLAAARETTTTHTGRTGLFRVLFGAPAGDAAAVDADTDNSNDADADGDGAVDGSLAGAPAVELIVDASWSMTLPLDSNEEEDRLTPENPDSRIAIAQAAMVNLIENTLPEGAPVAVRAFGNIEGNLACRTDLMASLQPLDRESLAAVVNSIDPQFNANTAIAASLQQVSNDLAETNREKIVVLLTDGQETCGGDPAAVIEQLVADGVQISVNVIGFAILDDELKNQFAEWAEIGNGEFFDASDAELLGDALERSMTVGYRVEDAEGSQVSRGVVGGRLIDLESGVYNILNSAGDIVYENVVITPSSVT
ncbi:MAG: VWA domain-containing protein, partial [Chloroflexota bacterium]